MPASPVANRFGIQAPTHKPSVAPAEPGRITKEALLRLRLAGPAQEEPLDLLQQRASFWATATHDLCQPAQALALFLERLRRLPPEASAEALHGYLQSSMQDLTRLLAGLMELAQIEAGEVQAARMVVSVDELFFRVREQLADQAQAKGLRWVVRPNGRLVLGDARPAVADIQTHCRPVLHHAGAEQDRTLRAKSQRVAAQGQQDAFE